MIAQPGDVVLVLGRSQCQELGVVVRIAGAGEHGVLPDQDPETVARVVERVGLEVAAAPISDHVRTRLGEQLQRLDAARVIRLAREQAGRDPVRAFREHGNAVHDERERLASGLFGLGLAPQDQRPKTDRMLPRVQRRAAGDEPGAQSIQRRRTDPVREPAPRPVHRQHRSGRAIPHRRRRGRDLPSGRIAQLDLHGQTGHRPARALAPRLDIDLERDDGLPRVGRQNSHPGAPQPGVQAPLDPHAPDADVHVTGAVVPAELGLRLANPDTLLGRVPAPRHLYVSAGPPGRDRLEDDLQGAIRVDAPRDVELERHESRVVRGEGLAAKQYAGAPVEPLEHEEVALARGARAQSGERPLEPPLALLDPAAGSRGVIEVGVRQCAAGYQRLVHAPWHGGRPV